LAANQIGIFSLNPLGHRRAMAESHERHTVDLRHEDPGQPSRFDLLCLGAQDLPRHHRYERAPLTAVVILHIADASQTATEADASMQSPA